MAKGTSSKGYQSPKPTGRPKPVTSKVSVTRDGRRRYGEGGKVK